MLLKLKCGTVLVLCSAIASPTAVAERMACAYAFLGYIGMMVHWAVPVALRYAQALFTTQQG